MIVGIGTDIVRVARFTEFWQRHGKRGLEKLLAPQEHDDCYASRDPGRFLAKRFAAKEALGKALGTGIRAPLILPSITIVHDDFGKPGFCLSNAADSLLTARRLCAHLSISDEQEYAVAFVLVESL